MNSKLCSLMLTTFCLLCRLAGASDLRQDFIEPPLKYATRPLWFWNNTTVTEEGVVAQMQEARDSCGYGGFGVLPFGTEFKPTQRISCYRHAAASVGRSGRVRSR